MRSRSLLVCLLLAVIGLMPACVAEPEDVRVVNELVDAWIDGWVADDPQAVAAVFTEDGVLTDFDNVDHVGRDEIVALAAAVTMRPTGRVGATEPIDPYQDFEGYFVPVRFSDGNVESWFILAVLPDGELISRLVLAIETSEEPPGPSFLERLPGPFGSVSFLALLVLLAAVGITTVAVEQNRRRIRLPEDQQKPSLSRSASVVREAPTALEGGEVLESTPRSPRPVGRLVIGFLIVGVGVGWFLALEGNVPWVLVLPTALIGVGLVLLLAWRSPWRAGLIGFGGVLAVLVAVSAFGRALGYAPNTEWADFTVTEPVGLIVLEIDSGTVEVVAGVDTVEVQRKLRFGPVRPALTDRLDGDTLTIDSDCSSSFLWTCWVNHFLTVPESVSIDINTGAGGEIIVDGLTGSVTVHSGTNWIRLNRLTGAVTAEASSEKVGLARTASGAINAEAISSEIFSASTDAGSITLEFSEAPDRLNLVTESGSVKVTVPGGAYRLDLQSSSGTTGFSDVVDDPSASREIVIRTGSGSIQVTGS